ncbi:MAG: hypothetical protein ABI641_12110 [Caldimonas sp.]
MSVPLNFGDRAALARYSLYTVVVWVAYGFAVAVLIGGLRLGIGSSARPDRQIASASHPRTNGQPTAMTGTLRAPVVDEPGSGVTPR